MANSTLTLFSVRKVWERAVLFGVGAGVPYLIICVWQWAIIIGPHYKEA